MLYMTDTELAAVLPCIVYAAEYIHNQNRHLKDYSILRWQHNHKDVLKSERPMLEAAARYQLEQRAKKK